MAAFLDIEHLDKRFGAVQTLHDINLQVEDGEFVVFVGPSGCGKSTLLRLIAGLEEASAGRIAIAGRDVTHAAPAGRNVAMVFQSYALYPHMTVAQNLSFGMRMRGLPRAQIEAKLARAVATLQLQPVLARKPGELSGGQAQRVAIGRALVQDPAIFLFDEPLSNLDAELRLRMRLEIAALHRELKRTMIYVTHDQVEAMTLADRIVVLRAGRVEQVGSPLALYADPANRFVAGFIGSPAMNFLPAELSGTSGGTATARLSDGSAWSFVSRPGATLLPGMPLQVGVRPEHLALGADTGLAGDVQLVERLGGSSLAYVASAAAASPLCVALGAGAACTPGQRVSLQPLSGQVYAFDEHGSSVAAAKPWLQAAAAQHAPEA